MSYGRAFHRLGVLGAVTALNCWLLDASAAGAGTRTPPESALSGSDERVLAEALAWREYEVTPNPRGLQAPNRAHGLRSYFEPHGVRIHDRSGAGSPQLLSLTLSGVGRGAELASVAPGAVTHAGNRVEIRRPRLVEWFVNSDAGLEQGFTLAERPAGAGELALELSLSDALAAPQGDDLVLATHAGRRLHYGKLLVVDAAGRTLPARFELPAGDRIRIVLSDTDAAYPVVIDPLLTESADATVEASQDHANLGVYVEGAGDVNGDGYADVLAGAPFYDDGQFDEGAVFVFHGGPSGITSGGPLVASAKITADQIVANLAQCDGAGDVNGDGYDDVIVGAQAYNAGQGFREGVALVFHGGPAGVGNGSPANADAVLESNQGEAWFASSVAGAGDVNGDGYADVIVGAYRYGASDEGGAFVFHGSASGIANGNPSTADASLLSAQPSSEFGSDVAGAGDVNGDGYGDVVVGAAAYDLGSSDEGAAFVFLGSASGIADGGPLSAATVLQSNQGGAHFGQSVAGAGDVNGDGYADVIVGADAYTLTQLSEGTAYTFHGSSGGIANGDPTTANGRMASVQADAHLGSVVAGAGDVNGDGYADVVTGAYLYDGGGDSNAGAAFVLLGSASGIGLKTPSTAFAALYSGQIDGQLGVGAAGAGDVNGDGYADVVAGALGYDGGNTNEGAAFIYHGGAQGVVNGNAASAAATLEGGQMHSDFGLGLAAAGDVNGDGYADLIVGAPAYDLGEINEGAAFVFHGGASGIANLADPSNADAVLQSNQALAFFGTSVGAAGDVNGDGYGDVIAGAPFYDAGQTNEGAAFVFLGSTSGIPDANPATTGVAQLEGEQACYGPACSGPVGFAVSVAGAGDVNGDGYADVIVGSPFYNAGQLAEGAAFVFPGSASGIADGNTATPGVARLESNQTDGKLGVSVASAGDTNGDGFADVIVAAEEYDALVTDGGAAFVFPGGAGFGNANPATAGVSQLASHQGGTEVVSVAGAGDVDGDGYGDVIVGSIWYGSSEEGGAFVFHGGPAGPGDEYFNDADGRILSGQIAARLGSSVSGAGDVNDDGYADVIVGALNYDNGQTDEGAAFMLHGGQSGIGFSTPATADAQLESDVAASSVSILFGHRVAGVGDVNGDGFSDVAVAAHQWENNLTEEGGVFVYYGNGNRTGKRVLAQQAQSVSNFPSQPWGLSNYWNLFRINMSGQHPAGRGLVKLQWEVCPAGVPFGGPQCMIQQPFGAWTTVTPTTPPYGVTFGMVASSLAQDTLYHWRARVLHAQPSAGALPPNPAHGPWRRVLAQVFEADIRTAPDTDLDGIGNPLDPDDDGDGLDDVDEIGTYGTDPLDADTDDDGLQDGPEIALGTDPNDPDHDDDGDLDGADNCPFIQNPDQLNGDSFTAGDDCQCGDVTGDGTITPIDYTRAREYVAGRTPSGAQQPLRCDVTGDQVCGVADLAVLDRIVNSQPATLLHSCSAYFSSP